MKISLFDIGLSFWNNQFSILKNGFNFNYNLACLNREKYDFQEYLKLLMLILIFLI